MPLIPMFAIILLLSVVLPQPDVVLRIETIGGNVAPSNVATGIMLTKSGYVLTSAYNFSHEPTSIIVRLPDKTQRSAKKLASDMNLMLTLLKVETNSQDDTILFPVVLKKDVRVGQSVFAVGAVLSPTELNYAAGIVSGKDRIWGKAFQTDAAVSPNNYGGPLCDSQGRFIGILVPLSMTDNAVIAGAELYDSGVGFAVPFEDFLSVFPKLKQGVDLLPADIGINFNGNTLFTGQAIVESVRENSPAQNAGIQSGDIIVKINGTAIKNALNANTVFKRLYSGDTITLVLMRNGNEYTAKWSLKNAKLVGKD